MIVSGLGDLLPFPKRLLVSLVVKYVKKMVPSYQLATSVALRSALQKGALENPVPVEIGYQDYAFFQYTGGTTGVSKGAMLNHENIVANVAQCTAWIAPLLVEGQEKIITALPLYHIFSLTANCLLFMAYGGENVLITNPRDIPQFVKVLAKTRYTAITGVNTLFYALLANEDFQNLDFAHLKLSLAGGMAVKSSVAQDWQKPLVRFCVRLMGLQRPRLRPALIR